MTPNEGYQRRLGEWQKKEREREEVVTADKPYDPADMKAPVPLGCVILVVVAVLGIAYFFYRLIKLGIL